MSDAYCKRCVRQFRSVRALQQHENNSRVHASLLWICPVCKEGFYNDDQLSDHQNETSHHPYFCRPCNRVFENPNNLNEHNKVHLPRTIECPCCDQFFTLYGGLFLHLESNNCIGLYQLFEIAWVMDRKGAIMLDRVTEPYYNNNFDDYFDRHDSCRGDMFFCGGCNRDFKKLSGLAQHLESGLCDHPGYISILKNLVRGLRSGKRFTLRY